VEGNPKLKITKITNLDLRFEYFPTLREVLAVSLFYKHFRDPIEEIVRRTEEANYDLVVIGAVRKAVRAGFRPTNP